MSLPTWAKSEEEVKGEKVLKGAAITISSGAARFLGSFVTALILGRILTPDDFGLVAMVAPILAFVMAFSDSGIASYTLQVKKVTEHELNHTFWLAALSAVLFFLIFLVLNPLITTFYNEDRLTAVTFVMSIVLLLSIFTSQHNALVKRCFRQDIYAIAEIVGALSGLVVSVTLALLDFGYWALVSIPIARQTTHAITIWIMTGWVPSFIKLDWEKSKVIISFGTFMIISQVVGVFGKNIDKVLIGWKYGTVEAGHYNMAYSIMMLPFLQILTPAAGAVVPYYSRLYHDTNRLDSALYSVTFAVGAIIIPFMVWASLVSEHLLIFVLGDKWAASSHIFSFLAIASVFMAFGTSLSWSLIAIGRPKTSAHWSILITIFTVAACFVGLQWEGEGVAASLMSLSFISFLVFSIIFRKMVGFSALTVLYLILRLLICGIIPASIICVLLHSGLIPHEWHFTHIAVNLVLMLLIFYSLLYLMFKQRVGVMVSAIRSRISR